MEYNIFQLESSGVLWYSEQEKEVKQIEIHQFLGKREKA